MSADKPPTALRRATVDAVRPGWDGVELLTCAYTDGAGVAGTVTALNYVDGLGHIEADTAVVVNTSALEAGLGTGGYAFVVARCEPEAGGPATQLGANWLVKARYSPSQVLTRGVDEQGSAYHDILADADSLDGMPVVAADLHSSLPAIIAGVRMASARPLRVAYVMTDGGALPIAFSRTVAELVAAGWIDATITVGQAYGGDYEAVSVHSGLLAAHLVAKADVTVVCQGPGNLGTDTRWGFSGVGVGEAVNASGVLGGHAIGCLRMSQADSRARHRGVSHHSLTAFGRVAMQPADLVLPRFSGELAAWTDMAKSQLKPYILPEGIHRLVEVDDTGLFEALHTSPVKLSTMGRGLGEDPIAFLAAAAAGRWAAHTAENLEG